ncbi:MAG: Coenzyme F420 hydrogenase/dehydrogenase, beta subunit C-terminal domain [Clostridia bacterium]
MICEKEKCTGCFACYNKCPQKCISMKEDAFGAIYPCIDEQKCIHCHLCEKTCPVNHPIKGQMPLKCFAMKSIQKEILRSSTSGGAATIFSKKILEQNGVVYGASFMEDRTVTHIRVEQFVDLKKLQGSKYVHSYMNDTFKQIEIDLKNNRKVLLIGTPCQIGGLHNYLKKEHRNLYTMDIVCHGVPTQKFLQDEINNLVGKKQPVDAISFRNTDGYMLKLYHESKQLSQREMVTSKYYLSFMNGISCRENCYTCPYANLNRVSDITIGDFWGLGKDSAFFETKEEGVSLILPITQKGLAFLQECQEEMQLEERNIEEAIQGNNQLRSPTKKSKQVEIFRNQYIHKGYRGTYNFTTFKMRIKNSIEKLPLLHTLYKKIKGVKNV